MSLKLLADKYVELNVQSICEVTGENCCNFTSSNNYVFLYCRSGTMVIDINEKEIELKENEIYLIPANSEYCFRKGIYSTLYLEFNGASVDELIDNSVFANGNYFLTDDAHLGYYFYKIYHAYHEAEFLSIKCLGILYELFYELTKRGKNIEIDYNSQQRHIEMAKNYINQNYHLEISISDVAKKVGVTSNYLANIFANYLQKTPKSYLTEVRMEQAKKLLSTHKYKIKDVGKLVGYKNQLHFSSEFKKYTGDSPLNFSKKH